MSAIDVIIWTAVLTGAMGLLTATAWACYRAALVIMDMRTEFVKRQALHAHELSSQQRSQATQRQENLKSQAEIAYLRTVIAKREQEVEEVKGGDSARVIRDLKRDLARLTTSETALQQQVKLLATAGGDDPRLNLQGIASLVVELLRENMPVAPSAPIDATVVGQAVVEGLKESGQLDADALGEAVVQRVAPTFEGMQAAVERLSRHIGEHGEVTGDQLGDFRGRMVVAMEGIEATRGEMTQLRQEVRGIVVAATQDLVEALRTGGVSSGGSGAVAPSAINVEQLVHEVVQRVTIVIEDSIESLRAALASAPPEAMPEVEPPRSDPRGTTISGEDLAETLAETVDDGETPFDGRAPALPPNLNI